MTKHVTSLSPSPLHNIKSMQLFVQMLSGGALLGKIWSARHLNSRPSTHEVSLCITHSHSAIGQFREKNARF